MSLGGWGTVELPIASTTIGMVTFSLLALTHLSVTIVKKDGHMSMTCLTKKGFNLKICGFGMPSQAFYKIHVSEDEESCQPKSFPRILTLREGVANEDVIDAELKHLFNGPGGRYSWQPP
jgi:hypothetical protein